MITHESENDMSEHLHHITHIHRTGEGIEAEFTCTGNHTSPCHQYPEEAETWYEKDWPQPVAYDACWVLPWMEENGCAKFCAPEGESVRSGPINVTWNGDCVEWEYIKEEA